MAPSDRPVRPARIAKLATTTRLRGASVASQITASRARKAMKFLDIGHADQSAIGQRY